MLYHHHLMYIPNQSLYLLLYVVMKHDLLPSQAKHTFQVLARKVFKKHLYL